MSAPRALSVSGGPGGSSPLSDAAEEYLAYLATHGYAATTLNARRYHLSGLISFIESRDVSKPADVTPALLDSFQRHLFHHRKHDGAPLSFRTQAQRLIPVKAFFCYLARTGAIAFDPSAQMVLPKTEHRLPEAILSVEEVEAVLAGPVVFKVIGFR